MSKGAKTGSERPHENVVRLYSHEGNIAIFILIWCLRSGPFLLGWIFLPGRSHDHRGVL